MNNIFLLSLAVALFVYILLMIYFKDNSKNFLISLSTGLFIFLLSDLFIGENSVFSSLEKSENKEHFQNPAITPISIKLDNSQTKLQAKPQAKPQTKPLVQKQPQTQQVKNYPPFFETCNVCRDIYDVLYEKNLTDTYSNLLSIYSDIINLKIDLVDKDLGCSVALIPRILSLRRAKLINMKYTSRVPSQKLNMILDSIVPIGASITVIKLLNAVTEKIEKSINKIIFDNAVDNCNQLKKLNELFYSKYYKPIVEKCSTKFN
jgi:hypothetical protein